MFSNGAEYMAFLERQCGSCALYRPNAEVGKGCPVEEAIGMAAITGKEDDFPYEWLEPNGYMHRYDCRKKARKRPNPIYANTERKRLKRPKEQREWDWSALAAVPPLKGGATNDR